MSTAESRKKNVYLAKLAERAERYEDMAEAMDKVVITVGAERLTAEERLTKEEKNLLILAYKKMTLARMSAWRVLSSIENNEEGSGNEDHVAIIKNYRSKIETEISNICDRMLNLLDSHLIPAAVATDLKVFYLKMKGDYQRCHAEIMTGTKREEAAENILLTYKSAQDIAVSELGPANPVRLGLGINFSKFYYEILNSTDDAIKLATQAYEEADTDLEALDENIYKDSRAMMKLLEDHLIIWCKKQKEERAMETDESSTAQSTPKGQL